MFEITNNKRTKLSEIQVRHQNLNEVLTIKVLTSLDSDTDKENQEVDTQKFVASTSTQCNDPNKEPSFDDELEGKIVSLIPLYEDIERNGESMSSSGESQEKFNVAFDKFINWYIDIRHEASYDF